MRRPYIPRGCDQQGRLPERAEPPRNGRKTPDSERAASLVLGLVAVIVAIVGLVHFVASLRS